ncbi:hypothetical protein DH2020_037501 [Rehmannia glutinosa]|uniref:C3H1-type domain-containing protein n=1 Tax=Rehmannia glutinosa TaxID=99300 RepID=A0ABR0V364_REHGL
MVKVITYAFRIVFENQSRMFHESGKWNSTGNRGLVTGVIDEVNRSGFRSEIDGGDEDDEKCAAEDLDEIELEGIVNGEKLNPLPLCEMQTENISYDALVTTSAADKSSASSAAQPSLDFSLSNPFLSPTSPTYVSSNASFYSSLFQKYSPTSPSDTASFDGGDTDRRLHDANCVLEYQKLYNRYTFCLAQLRDSMEEVDALRRENDSLRLSNADLSHRSPQYCLSSAAASRAAHLTSATQPLAENNRVERRSTQRVTLPKSISVRSSGYLKMTPPGRDTIDHKAVSQPAAASSYVPYSVPNFDFDVSAGKQQRVYVPGPKKEEALELDVYNQGMWKTELCNKWQETGACPYGQNCQFAHGIKELRPVIRHPRYKTEVCRMVLAGDICPYGHRCHFRHSLTEQERLMAPPPHRC